MGWLTAIVLVIACCKQTNLLYFPGFSDTNNMDDDDKDDEKEMEITYTKDEQGNGTVVLSEYR